MMAYAVVCNDAVVWVCYRALWAPHFLYGEPVVTRCISQASESKTFIVGGLVGAASFVGLPNVSAGAAAGLVLVAMVPALVRLWRRPLPAEFGGAAAYACLCSFVFGYHVHEKAILMVSANICMIARRFMLAITGIMSTAQQNPLWALALHCIIHRFACCCRSVTRTLA